MNHRNTLGRANSWRKSSHSERANACVETATEVSGWVGVRDSKLGSASPVLAVSVTAWQRFVGGLHKNP
jgi:Domain of unknown function (DUF397)